MQEFTQDFNELLKKVCEQLEFFEYTWNGDKNWHFYLPAEREKDWGIINIMQYQDRYFLTAYLKDRGTIEYTFKEGAKENTDFGRRSQLTEKNWTNIIKKLLNLLQQALKNPFKVNQLIAKKLPLNMRSGKVPHAIARELCPDLMRVDKDLGAKKTRAFVALWEKRTFEDPFQGHYQEMTLGLYLEYCRIAYLANPKENYGSKRNEKMTGLELYKIYADGRDEGLCEIDLESPEAFEKWYESKRGGGHPWEICRGGNTNHISLGVTKTDPYGAKKENKWKVYLSAGATTRMEEGVRMALALHEQNKPICVYDAKSWVHRLLGQDVLGIFPEFDSLHRGWQQFHEDEKVYDCIHYRDLGRKRNQALPFISWEFPSPIIKKT